MTRPPRSNRYHVPLWAIAVGIVAACGAPGGGATPSPTPDRAPSFAPTANSTASAQDVMAPAPFSRLEPGTYSIDPDGDPSTTMRVVFDLPSDGWSSWIGAAKFSDVGHVGVSITTVSNLVTEGCRDHSWADPPIGPSVDDLAGALAALAPFEVTSPATDVTMAGYRGTHLAWTVPALPVEGEADSQTFTGCVDGQLKSWVAFIDTGSPGDAFYGYTGPDYVEEFWILDVDGTRLLIAAEASPGSPSEDVAERDAILDSIRIEP